MIILTYFWLLQSAYLGIIMIHDLWSPVKKHFVGGNQMSAQNYKEPPAFMADP